MADDKESSGAQKSLGDFAPALVHLADDDAVDAGYRAKYAARPYLSPMISARARAVGVQISPRTD